MSIARTIGDLLLAPFSWMPPLAAVIVLSLACGLLLLAALRWISPQRRLGRVKELMSATIYEMRIFSSRPGRVLAAQGRALVLTVAYLLLTLPALVVLAPPMGLMLARAATHYEFRPLEPGEVSVMTIQLDRAVSGREVRVRAEGAGVVIKPPVVVIQSQSRVYLRVKAIKPGAHDVRIEAGDKQVVVKSVQVGRSSGPVSLYRTRGTVLAALLSHEGPIASGSRVLQVGLDYPQRTESWLRLPWYLVLLVVSLVTAFALRRRLGVVL